MLVEYELLRDLRVLQGKYEELMKENERNTGILSSINHTMSTRRQCCPEKKKY